MNHVKPTSYDIALHDLDFETFEYKGLVKVELQIKRPTKDIILNAYELKIHDVQVSIQDDSKEKRVISYWIAWIKMLMTE
ncbi:MAG: hypothetical protein Q9225_004845 [Loekoesia sp. 1 TL-2023]